MVIDTQRVDHLSPYGADTHTPHIQQLAKEGIRFDAAYAHAAITAPSHASMFTSLLVSDHGLRNNGDRLGKQFTTLAEVLQENGWATGGFISLQILEGSKGFAQGFDHFEDQLPRSWWAIGEEVNDKALPWIRERGDKPFFAWVHYSDPHEPYLPPEHYPRLRIEKDGNVLAEFEADGRRTTVELELDPGDNELTMSRVEPAEGEDGDKEEQARSPLLEIELRNWKPPDDVEFSFEGKWGRTRYGRSLPRNRKSAKLIATNATSDGGSFRLTFSPRARQKKDEKRRGYAEEVEYVDGQVGRLFQELEDMDVWEDTLVVLTSDHGEELGEKGRFGHVHNLYEQVIRVPLILAMPGRRSSVDTVAEPVPQIDLMPTILEVLELSAPEETRGRSLVPFDEIEERKIVVETFPSQARAHKSALRFGRYKFVRNHETDKKSLYDLELDPDGFTELNELGQKMLDNTLAGSPIEAAEEQPARELTHEERDALKALGYIE